MSHSISMSWLGKLCHIFACIITLDIDFTPHSIVTCQSIVFVLVCNTLNSYNTNTTGTRGGSDFHEKFGLRQFS